MCTPQVLVVDDFLSDPDNVRKVALEQRFVAMHSAGLRTEARFLHLSPYLEKFQRLLCQQIIDWNDNCANGRFQVCFKTDSIPYHADDQSYAGVLFLTPDAPIAAGLSFFRGIKTGLRRISSDTKAMAMTFGGGAEFDRSRWEEYDRISNIYNRLVLFDARLAHGASAYFGDQVDNARLIQNFFFNVTHSRR